MSASDVRRNGDLSLVGQTEDRQAFRGRDLLALHLHHQTPWDDPRVTMRQSAGEGDGRRAERPHPAGGSARRASWAPTSTTTVSKVSKVEIAVRVGSIWKRMLSHMR